MFIGWEYKYFQKLANIFTVHIQRCNQNASGEAQNSRNINSDVLPLLDPHHTLQRLPQESLPSFQRLLIKIKFVSPESCSHNQRQLHLSDVSSNAGPRSIAEGNKTILLPLS